MCQGHFSREGTHKENGKIVVLLYKSVSTQHMATYTFRDVLSTPIAVKYVHFLYKIKYRL